MNKKHIVPVVELDEHGRYSVLIAPGCLVSWWLESREQGFDHWRVSMTTPKDVPVTEVASGDYTVTSNTRN
jgi:hypothetical protein